MSLETRKRQHWRHVTTRWQNTVSYHDNKSIYIAQPRSWIGTSGYQFVFFLILSTMAVTELACSRTTKDVVHQMTAGLSQAPKITPCIFSCHHNSSIYNIKWSGGAKTQQPLFTVIITRCHAPSAAQLANQRAPLTPLSTIRPYCTHCLLCPLPSPAPRGVCYWILISLNYMKLLHCNCVTVPAQGRWHTALIGGNV